MGFVYFIQHGNTNYMKIGKTDGPIKNRIRGLQTGNPQGLTIFASIIDLVRCWIDGLFHVEC